VLDQPLGARVAEVLDCMDAVVLISSKHVLGRLPGHLAPLSAAARHRDELLACRNGPSLVVGRSLAEPRRDRWR